MVETSSRVMSASSHTATPGEVHALWVFTPSRANPEDLEFILVQRHALLQDAVDRVVESATTEHKHHLLFVGPRGSGKTHLVTLIVSRLSANEQLADRLRIAWLNEDETCTSLLELLFKIHIALQKRYPEEFRAEQLNPAYDQSPEAALEFVSEKLLSSLGQRTLLVVTENLDALFEGMGDSGQKQLRAFIQENPKFCLVATAQRLVDSLTNRINPFFGFFQTEHLKPLTLEEATQLLQNIARLQEKPEVADFLATHRGRSRVRAIHHLSGGNHRIYIVLSQFITRESIDSLVGPFLKMVDELTPYYQERVHWLSPLQRRIVEYLCRCETTMPVKEIAKRLFATPQTISKQLQELREKGYVEAQSRGRESLYEVSEPLMRICVEVKENQPNQPLRLLVDFLRVWFDDGELARRLELTGPTSLSRLYLQSALQRNNSEGNLRIRLMLEDLGLASEGPPSETSEDLLVAAQCLKDGDAKGAINCFNELIAEECDAITKAIWFAGRGIAHVLSRDNHRAIRDFDAVMELPDKPAKLTALALVSRGLSHLQAGNIQRAIADFTATIELPDAPVEQIAEAHLWRGVVFVCTHPKEKAAADFNALIHLPGAPSGRVISAHLALAELHFNEGRWDQGFEVLDQGLAFARTQSPPDPGDATGVVDMIFTAGLDPKGRQDKVAQLLGVYGKHQALPNLGDAVVRQMGQVFQAGEPFPSSDNLEGWAVAWEQAAENVPEFRLPMRLLRTSVDFVKAGGKDRTILFTLTSPERALVEQSLGLTEDQP